jgi:anti-sigma regulatory factor (Ser/Thr protein kinase)
MANNRSQEIRSFIIEQIGAGQRDIAQMAQEKFGTTRQAVNRHLRNLVAEGILTAEGRTRQRTYQLAPIKDSAIQLAISPDLHEDEVWRNNVRPLLDGAPDNVLRICNYGLTEIVNNAVDHSEGATVLVRARRTAAAIELTVHDDGVGIFRKIKRDLNLEDERYAILELAKGKLTTNPRQHTGEGIFFCSRSFDEFVIRSGALLFSHTGQGPNQDWLLEDHEAPVNGTWVQMKISLSSTRQLGEVFGRFTSESDDYGFSRTVVPVTLARLGDENLVSRSQARRLLTRVDRFREVLLDFKEIGFIGQAFADEVFRVFRNQHPEINLQSINASPAVESTIIAARATPSAPV